MPKLCEFENCRKRGNYGPKGERCSAHRGSRQALNQYCPCGKVAVCNFKGELKGVYCSTCKTEGMVNVKSRTCMCGKRPHYNIRGETYGVCCATCRDDDMIDVSNTKCMCGKIPYYNYPGQTKGIYCAGCKLEGMEDVKSKKCKGQGGLCNTTANKKYRGYCAYCYQHEFPNDVLALQIRCKTKEIAVRQFIDINYEGFIHDRLLETGNCDCTIRRRPDHRILIGNTMLCIETDENQHRSYSEMDEETRDNDLFMAFGGKWIYIRFNPDKYKNAKGKSVNPTISTRLRALGIMIDNQLARAEAESNTELVERYYMFYDGTK